MSSEPRDSTTVRSAGLVLCAIGVVSWFASLGWNAMGDYPEADALETVSGLVEIAEVREIRTRTSIKRWDVVEVVSALGGGGVRSRWVFPANVPLFDDAVMKLGVGDHVTARVRPEPENLRWSQEPVRIVWSLSNVEGEMVGYDEIIRVLDEARYQSPAAALMVISAGVALVLVSRIQFHRAPHSQP